MYERIAKLREECFDSYEKTQDDKYLRKAYSIDVFFECKVYKKYQKFTKFCKENGFDRVFDIGCAFGFQSEVFLETGVSYVGINEDNIDFWNKDVFKYIAKHYPFEIKARDTDLAVSSLCLAWNCYLYEGEKTLKEQCEALSRDFKSCLLYIPNDKIEFVSSFFKKTIVLQEDTIGSLVYFTNKK